MRMFFLKHTFDADPSIIKFTLIINTNMRSEYFLMTFNSAKLC